MERGEAFGHLRLVEINSSGKEIGAVQEPFREVELWDETFTRLTLWLHPGRQKPGVNLNVEIGPVLEEGKRYRLEVSRNWRVEGGRPLDWLMVHEFLAGPSDVTQPDPKGWKVEAKEGLVRVKTDEALDPESLRKRVAVVREGETVAEVVVFEAVREGFTIRPNEAMAAGRWRLVIDPKLEDLAGNSIARPFNLDLDQGTAVERTEAVEIVFDVP